MATRTKAKRSARRAKAPAKRTARKPVKRAAKASAKPAAAKPAAKPKGPHVDWWEITLSDKASSDKVKQFFTSVFGWKIESDPQYDYGQVSDKQAGIGGGIGPGAPGAQNRVTFYISVNDPNAYLRKIEAAGGKTVMPTMSITPTTTIAQFADPAGNVIGLVKAGSM